MPRKNALMFILIPVILISALGLTAAKKADKPSMKFDTLTFTSSIYPEYPSSTQTSSVQYFFDSGTEKENTTLVHNAEIIIAAAKQKYNINPSSSSIFITGDSSKTSVKLSQSKAILNPNDIQQQGALFYYISDGALPAWLCAGLELYWMDQYGIENPGLDKKFNVNEWYREIREKGLPELGDEWFVSGFVDDSLAESIPSVAYAFVEHLENKELLANLVAAYLDEGRLWEAERMRSEAWQAFTGQDSVRTETFMFRYLYDPYRSSSDELVFCIQGTHGKYYFTRAYWTVDKAIYFAESADDSIRYTKDWFGYIYDDLIDVVFTDRINYLAGGVAYGTNGFYIYNSPNTINLQFVCVHESVHVLLRAMGIKSNFPYYPIYGTNYLEEGLGNALGTLYSTESRCSDEFCINRFLEGPTATKEYLKFYELGVGGTYTDFPFDYHVHADLMALVALYKFESTGVYGQYYGQQGISPTASPQDVKYGYLMTYDTSSSFILRLLSKGTNKDFMDVFIDINRMEEIYGKDIDSIIDEWMEELYERFPFE